MWPVSRARPSRRSRHAAWRLHARPAPRARPHAHARSTSARAAGRLHRLHHAVYSLVPRELLKREGLAWPPCSPADPAQSCRTAPRPHSSSSGTGAAPRSRSPSPSAPARRHDGIKVHRSTTLTDEDVTVVNNIPCTTVARTLLDLGDVVTHRQLERSFDQAEISERARPHSHRRPARPQPHPPRRQSRPPRPRDPLHRQDAYVERERGGAPGDHAAARHPRSGHQPVRRARRRRPADPRRLRLARATASSSRPTARNGTRAASDSNRTACETSGSSRPGGRSSAPPGAR